MTKPKTRRLPGTGWREDPPDPRDRTPEHEKIRELLARRGLGARLRRRKRLPARVDLRPWCPPVRFQGGFATCAAHVVAALLEYYEKRAFGKTVDASRLFLHKVGTTFLGERGNVGVYIRQTMGVLRLIGVPPERYWPYPDPGTIAKPRTADPRLDAEPTAFCYAIADDFRAVSYYRLDSSVERTDGAAVLERLRRHLAQGLPVAFGVPIFESFRQTWKTGRIPFPQPGEKEIAKHAFVAVGYDDRLEIRNRARGARATTGAVLLQNSWSEQWGEKGYGWLPYDLVSNGAARDFWTLLRAEWVDTGRFQLEL
ncbi:MAG: C1 family peptidase [Thermoanaerobaculia bacterium]